MARRLELVGALLVAIGLVWLATVLPGMLQKHVIVVRGSDTGEPLAAAWARAFERRQSGLSVTVTGGGSSSGIAAFSEARCDVAVCSRPMRAAETADVSARRGGARAVVVAIAAVTVAVHASNPIDDLTLGQVADIFSGKKRSWSDIGGPNRPITVLASPPGTGPYAFFRDHAIRLGDDASPDGYAPFVTFISDPDALAARVATDADAIAALGISAVRPGTKALKIAERSDREPIAPSVETAADGRYPLARPLLFYVPSSTPGDVADFLAFCRSDGGQDVARRLDFVPVPEPDVLSRLLR